MLLWIAGGAVGLLALKSYLEKRAAYVQTIGGTHLTSGPAALLKPSTNVNLSGYRVFQERQAESKAVEEQSLTVSDIALASWLPGGISK